MSADRAVDAEMARIHAECLIQTVQPTLEEMAASMACMLPAMLAMNGPGYFEHRAVLDLPGGLKLRFVGSLEIVE